MAWVSLSKRLSTLPLVLAGPILRRVEKDSVSVWVALKEARTLTLTVYDDGNQVIMTSAARPTVALGVHLHIALITAKLPALSFPLSSDETYHYNVTGNGVDLTGSGTVVYTGQGFTHPTFSLPPSNIDNLRIVHASCRKMHAQGYDAFVAVDGIIKEEAKFPNTFAKKRPHQLFLTGDQIYADDVSGIQLFLIQDICDTLLGWNEEIKDNFGNTLTSPNLSNSACGARSSFIIDQAGFKFRFNYPFNEEEVPANHLMFLGEYYCMYLLMWSPVLWPASKEDYPTRNEIYTPFAEFTPKVKVDKEGKIISDEFEENLEAAVAFQKTLGAVQRSLANVPTYMICDDHEITDDWFITYEWTRDVLSSPVGTRILQNGLLAYTLFQAWGNTPERFEGTEAGKRLLDIIPQWPNYSGADTLTPSGVFPVATTYWQSIYRLLGLPDLAQTLSTRRLLPANPALYLTYNYHIAWENHEVFVLDTRNERSFPGDYNDPPVLISNEGLARQLTDFSDTVKITFLVIATPISAIPNVEASLDLLASFANIYFADGEVYVGQESAIESLYGAIGKRAAAQQQRKNSTDPARVVVLSGDVHYAFTNRVEYWADRTYNDTEQTPLLATPAHFVLAQLCASALKNEKGVIKDDEKKPGVGRTGTNKAHIDGYTEEELEHPKVIIGWVPPTGNKRVGTIPTPLISGTSTTVNSALTINPGQRVHNVYELAKIYSAPLPSLTLSVQPDWTYRIDYLTAVGGTPRPYSKPPKIATNPASVPPVSALQQYLDSASNAQEYTRYDGVGREAVGKNNLGEIRFSWGFTEDTKIVKHQLWWRLASTSSTMPEQEPFPLSEYEVVLGTDSAVYPKPVY
jgi:hypothetical protein